MNLDAMQDVVRAAMRAAAEEGVEVWPGHQREEELQHRRLEARGGHFDVAQPAPALHEDGMRLDDSLPLRLRGGGVLWRSEERRQRKRRTRAVSFVK